jgi:hypothetical protein
MICSKYFGTKWRRFKVFWHQKALVILRLKISVMIDKYDLGFAKDFTHWIHLKDDQPIFRKQFNLPEAHTQFIEQSLDKWLKLGVVRQSNSLYNSPIFCVPKKQGQGLRIVPDFRQLNQHSHIDKYTMKEINECIGDISRANSSIFTTLDLTLGFWQMKLEPESQSLTAFTIPSRGQFHWINSPIGVLGCPASFQKLMEQVLRGLQNILIYIDNMLIHTDTHEKHLEALEQVLMRLHQHHLKINLDKCLFGNREVSYLGFTLTPDGIKPGEAKLRAIKSAAPPGDVKAIRSFMGLCNFFQNHIQGFAITAAPLFKLTRQDSGYLSGPLPETALQAFQVLQTQLSKQPALAFPRSEQHYLLITNAYTPDKDLPRGLCVTLAQKDKHNRIKIISHASRQLKENKKNYTKFLLKTAATAWGMDNFNEYLKGSKFTLYNDQIAEPMLGTTQVKTLNRLKTAMSEHQFETRNRQKSDLPIFLKQGQTNTLQTLVGNPFNFNKAIHVNAFSNTDPPEKVIITIMDNSTAFSVSTIGTDNSAPSIITALQHRWFQTYGSLETISFKQGKVQVSKLEKKINDLAPLEQEVTCKSRMNTFNTEVEQQWEQNQ